MAGLFQAGILYFSNGNLIETPVEALKDFSVSGICMDLEGGIWATTLEKELFRCPNPHVRVYEESSLKDRTSWLQVVDGKVFTGGKSNAIFEMGSEKIKQIPLKINAPNFEYTNLFRDKNTYFLTGKSFLLISNVHISNQNQIMNHGKISFQAFDQIFKGPEGKILGLYNKTLSSIENQKAKTHLETAPFKMKNAFLWPDSLFRIGSESGFFLYQNRKFFRESFLKALDEISISHQFSDDKNSVWICTKGAGIWHWNDSKLIQYSKKDGLSSKTCFQACHDAKGKIWIATNNGLNCLELRKNQSPICKISEPKKGCLPMKSPKSNTQIPFSIVEPVKDWRKFPFPFLKIKKWIYQSG